MGYWQTLDEFTWKRHMSLVCLARFTETPSCRLKSHCVFRCVHRLNAWILLLGNGFAMMIHGVSMYCKCSLKQCNACHFIACCGLNLLEQFVITNIHNGQNTVPTWPRLNILERFEEIPRLDYSSFFRDLAQQRSEQCQFSFCMHVNAAAWWLCCTNVAEFECLGLNCSHQIWVWS